MTIREMIARQQALLEAARAAGGSMTAEQTAEWNNLQRSIETALAAGHTMENGEPEEGEARSAAPASAPAPDPDAAIRAAQEERTRIRSIEDMCSEFDMDARQYIDNNSTVDAVSAAIIYNPRANR